MRPIIDSDLYLSANLDVGDGDNGKVQASLSWPQNDFHSQDDINLRPVLEKLSSYQTTLDFFAHSLPNAGEQKERHEAIAIELSNLIWETVFDGNLTDLINSLADIAHYRPLLLHVYSKGTLYESIPWEILGHPQCDAIRDKGLTLTVCKGKEQQKEWFPQRSEEIKIFLVESQSIDEQAINTEEEFGSIRDLFKDNNKVFLPSLPNLDYFSFCLSLEQNPHIVHLACHGEPDTVVFKRGEGTDRIPHNDIADAISSFESIGLVVLNACNSSNLARLLVEKGVPTAIGMSTEFSDFAAKEFSRWFYLSLKRGRSVCQAFHSAITNVRNTNKLDQLLWRVPMLYESQEITPFIDFLNTLRIDLIPPTWDKKEITEIVSRLQEFINAFERLKPDSRWTAYHWERETKRILELHISTGEAIKALTSNLPETYNLEAQDLIRDIRRAQQNTLQTFQDFDKCIPNWKDIDTDPKSKNEITSQFMRSGQALLIDTKVLSTKLRKAIGFA